MLLVVDANVLISALIARGKTADLLFCEQLQLIAPEFLLIEVEDHKDEIMVKSALPEAEVEEFLSILKAICPGGTAECTGGKEKTYRLSINSTRGERNGRVRG